MQAGKRKDGKNGTYVQDWLGFYLSLKTEVIIEFLYGMWLLDLSDNATIT